MKDTHMTKAHLTLASILTLGVLALTSTPAFAGANSAHGYIRALGSETPGEGAGQLGLVAPFHADPLEYGTPPVTIAGSGVAVDDKTHDVYVADTGNHRISEFGPKGEFVGAFGADVGSLGNTCTEIPGCKAGAVGKSPGELTAELQAPRFVAVDNSGGASEGDVYVGGGVGSEALNARQYIQFPGATGGAFTLGFEGETTESIKYTNVYSGSGGPDTGVDAVAVETALDKLAKIGSGGVRVSETQTSNGAIEYLEIEFIGTLAETTVATLGCDPSALSPAGASCQVSVGQDGSRLVGEVISKFSPEGKLEETWGVKGRLDGSTAPEGPFPGTLQGIAVDSAGNLWVLGTGNPERLFKFKQDGSFIENKGGLAGAPAAGIAINGEGKLVTAPEDATTGLALDAATGETFVDHLGASIEDFASSGTLLETFGPPELQGGAGVAVDSSSGEPPFSGTVYAANTVADQVDVFPVVLQTETGAASEPRATSMTLSGKVDPEGSEVGECYFEYGVSSEYEHNAPCEEPDAKELGSGTAFKEVHAKVTKLLGGTTYHFRLVAVKGTTTVPGDDVQAPTSPVPVVANGEAPSRDLVLGSAGVLSGELTATVDPEGLQVTHCKFEYGVGAVLDSTAKCEPSAALIGSGTEPVPVSAQITGLEPNVTYRWRLVVSDENGEAVGSAVEHTFVYPTTGTSLPDVRAYEMVSPPFKNGASLGHTLFSPKYALAEDGSRVIVQSIQCFAEAQSCNADYQGNEGEPFEFTRTPAGWETTALSPPARQFGENNTDWLLSPNEEGMTLFSMPTPPGGENDWYARQPEGSFQDVGPITPQSVFGVSSETSTSIHSTADLSHLVWQTKLWPFTEGSEQVVEYAGACGGRAECEAAQPFLVGVTGGLGSTKLIGGCATNVGTEESAWDALSADGRTVYFTACGALYARVDGETSEAHTVAVSQPQCSGEPECVAAEAHPSGAYFRGASEDGSNAFFTDTQKLTPGATEGTGSANLYESQCTSECERAGEQRKLIDVSAVPAGDTSGPEVLGVAAISADGSHVYFVANGALAGGVRPGHCRYSGAFVVGSCNLYVYERDERYPGGHLAFIATVPGTDSANWAKRERVTDVTPDGRFLVFASHGVLTPDDTRTDGYAQIFRYDADPTAEEEAAQTPQLVRISVGNDGFDDDGNAGVGAATIVPPEDSDRAGPGRGDPTMSNDGGYIFFQSPVQLTPQAPKSDTVIGQDGSQTIYAQNVYEYHEGHVYLISDGSDTGATKGACENRITGPPEIESELFESAVCLLGTDASGKDVFFTTADRLVPADTDTQTDVYDARVCEAASPCISEPPPALPPCLGEQCHGIPAATPSLLAPGTATFNGEGNIAPAAPAPAKPKTKSLTRAQKLAAALKQCKRDKKKTKRTTCEKQARSKYGPVKKTKKKGSKK
jgi:hypothetical protein